MHFTFRLMGMAPDKADKLDELQEKFGRRRYQVALLLFGCGLTQIEIARRMGITTRMVKYHVARIRREVGEMQVRSKGRHRIYQLTGDIAVSRN